jgi:hypothetical protein
MEFTQLAVDLMLCNKKIDIYLSVHDMFLE